MSLLQEISIDHFKNVVNIRFNNILNGFDLYSNGILEHCDSSASILEKDLSFKGFFKEALKSNNNRTIVDFYIKNLTVDEINILMDSLELNHTDTLVNHINNGPYNSVYFNLDSEDLMDFITTLNCKALLFSTVYFTDLPMTIWGNYDYKFPVFFETEEVLNHYKKIAAKHHLSINSIIYK